MLKNILNIEGAQKLTKNEQKTINGGVVAPGCKLACKPASKSTECCSGLTVSGNYPPCPDSGGAQVCL